MKLQNPFSPKAKKTKITLTSLNRWNKIMAGLHALQGVTVLVLARDVTFPISTRFLTLDPLASSGGQPVLVDASRALFDINLAYLVAAFFFMSAVSHWIMAMGYRDEYEKNLKKGINRARWYEYMFSASTMMVAIAVLAGVYELSALVMIFALTAVMNSMGLMMEIHNQ